MVLLARGIQTARIRHGDKGSLCRRMSNALTDESETLSLSSSLYSLAHFCSITLPLHLFSISFSPSLSLLSLSCRGLSVHLFQPPTPPHPPLSSYPSPSFSSCQMFFHSPFQSPSLHFLSFYSLAIFACFYKVLHYRCNDSEFKKKKTNGFHFTTLYILHNTTYSIHYATHCTATLLGCRKYYNEIKKNKCMKK